jgi:hypothetical protein
MELCMAEITVVALFVAKPGDEDKLSVVLEGIVGPTRKERGVLPYDLHRDLHELRRFSLSAGNARRRSRLTQRRHIEAYRKAAADWVEHGEIRVASKLA